MWLFSPKIKLMNHVALPTRAINRAGLGLVDVNPCLARNIIPEPEPSPSLNSDQTQPNIISRASGLVRANPKLTAQYHFFIDFGLTHLTAQNVEYNLQNKGNYQKRHERMEPHAFWNQIFSRIEPFGDTFSSHR